MKDLRGCAAAAAIGLAVAACTSSSASAPSRGAAPPSPAPASQIASRSAGDQVVNVRTGDYFFNPNEIDLHPGAVQVNLTNDGPRRHTFFVRNLADTDDLVKGDDRLVAGESETVTFTLPEPGRYRIYCAIPGHADRGEVGWLVVSPAAG